jgi:glutaredoxin 3
MSAVPVLIYTTQWCGYCSAAKALLKQKDVAYEEIDVGNDSKQREEMIERSGRRSVPQIFIHGESIGGFDQIAALDQAGELDKRLEGGAASDQSGKDA